MNCKCGNPIPQKRTELGYKECVGCSTVEAHGCIDIIYHKTGNTIQITDKQTAERMRLLSRRSGFGILRGMSAGKTSTHKPIINKNSNKIITAMHIPSAEVFNSVGAEALLIMEIEGYDSAVTFLQKKASNGTIFPIQMNKIKSILIALSPAKEIVTPVKKNWYSKYELPAEKKEVSSEIEDAFKYWKR